jgi:hypothetical protein
MPRARAASSGPGMAGWPARRCRARSPSWLFLRWRAMGTRDPSNPLHLFRRPAAAPRLLLLPASQRREGRRILGAKVRDEALPGHPILPPEAEPRSPPRPRHGSALRRLSLAWQRRSSAPSPRRPWSSRLLLLPFRAAPEAHSSTNRPPCLPTIPLPPLQRHMHSRRERLQFCISSLLKGNLPSAFASSVGSIALLEQ